MQEPARRLKHCTGCGKKRREHWRIAVRLYASAVVLVVLIVLSSRKTTSHYLDNTRDAQLGWAEMFIGADTYLCSTIGLCPKFTGGPEWQTLRKLMDMWSEGWLVVRPDAEEGGQLFYEELVA